MMRLAGYLKNYKLQIIIGPFFKLLEAIFELIVPLVMASIIDKGINGDGGQKYILHMGALMILLGFIGLCFALICQYMAAVASQGVGTLLRNDMFRHINSLSHAEIDKIGTTSLVTRITNDVNQIQLAIAMLIRLAIRAPFLMIGATLLAMNIDLKLSLVFIVMAILVTIVLYGIMAKSVPFYRVLQKMLDKVSLLTRENLAGARVVRAFSKQEREKEEFGDVADGMAIVASRVGRLSALITPLNTAILNISIIALLWFGGFRVNIGRLTQGEIIALINYMTQISVVLVVLANLVIIFTKAGASASRINEVFDIKSSINNAENAVTTDLNSKKHNIPMLEFRNVSFSYCDSKEKVLENISFSLERGQILGIIGGTGSGKSTLASLIPRFYEVSEGEILINGINIKNILLSKLRQSIGIVPQRAALFSGTIRDNIKWGNEKASDTEIEEALKIAQAKDFVQSTDEGLDRVIYQNAGNVSGGQKQRLTIARAIVKKPEILILDDSFSALDYATDANLRRELNKLSKDLNMTVIMISQRYSTIKNADVILVMDDGRIAGIGKHEELLASCEIYKEIYSSQSKNEEVGK
ncbi:MAG: ABC transporter ATP-binding protein [Eubacterium sp.]